MSNSIQIACNIDVNYVKYCSVMLISLFENNKESSFDIHIISDNLPEKDRTILNNIVKSYNGNLFFYLNSKDLISNLPIDNNSHISLSTYYRCFLTTILPEKIKKILYLDCDLLVVDSLKDIWNINIDNYPLAAVEDMWSAVDDNYSRLNYEKKYLYFNAGVMLLNLDYLRKYNLEKRVSEYAQLNYDKLLFNDQDILNGLFHETKLLIPFKWNMQDGFFRRRKKIRKEVWKDINDATGNPAIIHFTGSKKPWQYESNHPLKQEYFKYLDKSIWKGERPNINVRKWLEFKINSFLIAIKLLKPKYINIKSL